MTRSTADCCPSSVQVKEERTIFPLQVKESASIMPNKIAFSTDAALCIRSWSREAAAFTGRPADAALGHKYYDLLPPIMIDGTDAVKNAIRKKKAVTLKAFRFTCLYSHITASVRIVPRKTANGAVRSASVTIQPATTCSVAHKLGQQQKLIDIGKTASTLAHGVRNPLNALKGAVVYLNEKYRHEATLVEFTKIMQEEISHLETFITRFLSASASDREVSATDINALLQKIKVYTALQMFTRNIQADFSLASLPPVMMSGFHLEQVVLNVINNALDAMQHGGRLSVCTGSERKGDVPRAVITITDTGPGMPDRPLALPADRTGKGFGLLITYEILKSYDGELEVSSSKDAGTTVKISIPCGDGRKVRQ